MPGRYLGVAKELTPMRVQLGADLACPISTTTTVLVLAVPANSVEVGDTFEFIAHSINAALPNITLSMAVGASNPPGTQVWTTGGIGPNVSGSGVSYRGVLTVKSTGVSGTVMGGGLVEAMATVAPQIQNVSNTNATQPVDTTAVWYISFRVTLTASSATTMKSAMLRKVA